MRIEDGLYECPCVALCVAGGEPDPDDPNLQVPIAAIQVRGALDLDALAEAARALPEYARPRSLRVVDEIPLTDGYRAIKSSALLGGRLYRWDPRTQRFVDERRAAG